MSGGTDSIQTKIGKENSALLTRACAIALPCRRVEIIVLERIN